MECQVIGDFQHPGYALGIKVQTWWLQLKKNKLIITDHKKVHFGLMIFKTFRTLPPTFSSSSMINTPRTHFMFDTLGTCCTSLPLPLLPRLSILFLPTPASSKYFLTLRMWAMLLTILTYLETAAPTLLDKIYVLWGLSPVKDCQALRGRDALSLLQHAWLTPVLSQCLGKV